MFPIRYVKTLTHIRDISNQKFGKLTAIKSLNSDICGRKIWEFKCECGVVKKITGIHVINGSVISCGCYNKEKFCYKRREIIVSFEVTNKEIPIL